MRRTGLLAAAAALLVATTLPVASPSPAGAATVARGFPDFNRDGTADVVVPIDQQSIGTVAGAGGLEILYGSPFGSTPRSQYLSNSSPAVSGGVTAGGRFGQDWAAGDFNRDGYDDLAIGEYGATIGGHASAGQVHIFYGSASGLTDAGYQHIDLNEVGLAHRASQGDQFGHALAAGDLNGDGYADLVVSAPREAVNGASQAGAVYVFWGGANGLQFTAAQGAMTFHQGTGGGGIGGTAAKGNIFGSPVTIGDLDHDGNADIAIGVQGQAVTKLASQKTQPSGAFYVLYGNATKASLGQHFQFLTENSAGMPATPLPAAHLGGWFAAGDFDHDGTVDLAVAADGDDLAPVPNDGAVYILKGTGSGLTTTGSKLFDVPSLGIGSQAGNADNYGDSLVAGDFNRDGYADLVITVDTRNLPGVSGTKQGEILVLSGSAAGLTSTGMKTITEKTSGMPGSGPKSGDQFGSLVEDGDYNHDGYVDLYVAAAGRSVSGLTHAGAVYLLRGSASGITASGAKMYTQSSPKVAGGAQANAWYGSIT